jgi:hypothetical protein
MIEDRRRGLVTANLQPLGHGFSGRDRTAVVISSLLDATVFNACLATAILNQLHLDLTSPTFFPCQGQITILTPCLQMENMRIATVPLPPLGRKRRAVLA